MGDGLSVLLEDVCDVGIGVDAPTDANRRTAARRNLVVVLGQFGRLNELIEADRGAAHVDQGHVELGVVGVILRVVLEPEGGVDHLNCTVHKFNQKVNAFEDLKCIIIDAKVSLRYCEVQVLLYFTGTSLQVFK